MPFHAFCSPPHCELLKQSYWFCAATPGPRGEGRCWNLGQQAGYQVFSCSELAPWEFSWFNKYLLSMDGREARSESGNAVWRQIGPRCTLRPRLKEELREEQSSLSSLLFSKFTLTLGQRRKGCPPVPISFVPCVPDGPGWLELLSQLPPSRLI